MKERRLEKQEMSVIHCCVLRVYSCHSAAWCLPRSDASANDNVITPSLPVQLRHSADRLRRTQQPLVDKGQRRATSQH